MRALLQGDARALPLADESVQCVVTSPPYWGLRDYGVGGQLGLESTPEEYVVHMVEVFREVRRVLRPDGTLWLNLGDSYTSGGRDYRDPGKSKMNGGGRVAGLTDKGTRAPTPAGLKPKDLVGILWRVAFALQADGWWLRSDIVWSKPNPMPESVTDRPTKAHEYLFLLTKSERYFYDADAIREPARTEGDNRAARTDVTQLLGRGGDDSRKRTVKPTGAYRNARTVWTIATQPYPAAHFATFPEELARRPILAGSSPKACGVCAAPWERVLGEPRPTGGRESGNKERQIATAGERGRRDTHMGSGFPFTPTTTPTTGWRSTCEHDDDSGACLVFDPFNGSGTTGRVASREGRRYVGLDISREYLIEQATERLQITAVQNLKRTREGGQARMALD